MAEEPQIDKQEGGVRAILTRMIGIRHEEALQELRLRRPYIRPYSKIRPVQMAPPNEVYSSLTSYHSGGDRFHKLIHFALQPLRR